MALSGFQNFVTFIEDELVGEAPNQAKTSSDNTSSQPGRMRQMERTSKEFLKSLNPNLPNLNLESNNLNDPVEVSIVCSHDVSPQPGRAVGSNHYHYPSTISVCSLVGKGSTLICVSALLRS
ncbi:hypothetical protein Pst134EB_006059 [Puccinia striiformis f. sp. tritici]|nr:hypothetical protein Pst134EB_006059 [Puccinia striiformis f. sp. tritici]